MIWDILLLWPYAVLGVILLLIGAWLVALWRMRI